MLRIFGDSSTYCKWKFIVRRTGHHEVLVEQLDKGGTGFMEKDMHGMWLRVLSI
jgi:hypothetical protein